MFQHVSGIFVRCWTRCSNILARFNVLYLFKETTFPYLADQATRISVQNLLYFYSQKSNNILGNNWICLEVPKDVPTSYDFPYLLPIRVLQISRMIYFVLKPNKVNQPILLQYKRQTSRPNQVFKPSEKSSFQDFESLCVYSCIVDASLILFLL